MLPSIAHLLYSAFFIAPELASEAPTPLPANQCALVPIDMTSAQMVQLNLSQSSAAQDFSMRAWISQYPAGISLVTGLSNVFCLARSGLVRPLVIYLHAQVPPADCYTALVTPGVYYLNILNLTATPSAFALQKLDLA